MARKKIDSGWLLIPAVLIIFLFSVITWLSTLDSYTSPDGTTYTINGWEVLRMENHSFWTWVWLGTIGCVVFGILAYCNESGSGAIGRKLSGASGLTWLFVLLALSCFIIPWIPAMTVKTDGGQFLKPKTTTNVDSSKTSLIHGINSSSTHYTDVILPQGQLIPRSYKGGLVFEENMARCRWSNPYLVSSSHVGSIQLEMGTPYAHLHVVLL